MQNTVSNAYGVFYIRQSQLNSAADFSVTTNSVDVVFIFEQSIIPCGNKLTGNIVILYIPATLKPWLPRRIQFPRRS